MLPRAVGFVDSVVKDQGKFVNKEHFGRNGTAPRARQSFFGADPKA